MLKPGTPEQARALFPSATRSSSDLCSVPTSVTAPITVKRPVTTPPVESIGLGCRPPTAISNSPGYATPHSPRSRQV
ncbi:MAG TPA: hypothetical protein VMT24_07405 [Aggregatilineaceae bacterium]|nr:hypothetical protein [Aggregatilineaceae bacterium]